MSAGRFSDLPARIAVTIVAVIVLSLSLSYAHEEWFQPLLVIAISLFAAAGLWECFQLFEGVGGHPNALLGCGSLILFLVTIWYAPSYAAVVPALLLIALFVNRFRAIDGATNQIAMTWLGWSYLAGPFACILLILYHLPGLDGRIWVAYAVVITKAADAFAFFAGKWIGQRQLAPSVSPGKTIEGGVGALLGSVLVSVALIPWTGQAILSAAILGALLALFGIAGDLAESVLKREAGVKDSNQLQGVGGILDMTDSLLFTAPVLYFCLKL